MCTPCDHVIALTHPEIFLRNLVMNPLRHLSLRVDRASKVLCSLKRTGVKATGGSW